ncbi:hypothetical protein C8R44DRAFT_876254 [Mycena epipterygia]|nr:hypothetical protein C8R44DRAFT_876254 [Mycena epipterygia]
MVEGTTRTTASAYTAQDLALRLHCLGATTDGPRQLDPSHRNALNQRNGLEAHFANNKGLTDKFISVVQALATLCTPKPGKDNVAIMVGLTESELYVFCAQNGGAASQETASHIRKIWELVQKVHGAARVPPADPSFAPRAVASAESLITTKLNNLAYLFVKAKVLDRAAKRLAAVTAIHEKFTGDVARNKEDKELIELLFYLVTAAHIAFPHRFDKDFATQHDWLDFRSFTRILRDFANQPNHRETLFRLQSQVDEILKDSEDLRFDLDKLIEKLIKVEVALVTLYALAVSPRRSEFVERELVVHSIEVPNKSAIHVDVDAIEDWWYPTSMNRKEAIEKMRNNLSVGEKGVRLPTTIHSECQIVAWMAQNLNRQFLTVRLIPYVTCSKLHCFGCYTWLSSFNKLRHPRLPIICYDGSHGKLHPGWAPPSLGSSHDQKMRNLLIARVEDHFPKPTHSKERSASSTATDPQTYESAVEIDYERLLKRRARNKGSDGKQNADSTLSIPPPALDLDGDSTGGVGSALDADAKLVRKLNKKLKDIDKLKEKVKKGESLEMTQLQKIENEAEIRRELASPSNNKTT